MTLQEKLFTNTISLFNSFDSLSQVQAEFKPSPDSWSILECAEHIFIVDTSVSKSITAQVSEKTENDKIELFGEGKLNHLLVNKRTTLKVVAPDFALPTGRFKTLEEAKQNINAIINKIIVYLDTHKVDEDCQTIKHFRLGEMTKTDWVHFLIHHTNRHILQIEEVKLSRKK
ncbi:MAG: DinB family protein [Bacteroidetes bacterium]|nr:DinB family protein [Bacteroidota bacterium]